MSETTEVPTIETTGAVSKLDIKALRQAERIAFSYHAGESRITCIKPARNPGPFDERDKRYEISCYSEFCGYRDDDRTDRSKPTQCFEMIGNYADSPVSAVLAIVRPGDELSLNWIANNANGYLREALTNGQRIYRDDLYLKIRRAGKLLCRVFLNCSLCPDNTARMIRF